jgi:hypothetical protein
VISAFGGKPSGFSKLFRSSPVSFVFDPDGLKSGAGETIRTLDPNLGNGLCSGYQFVESRVFGPTGRQSVIVEHLGDEDRNPARERRGKKSRNAVCTLCTRSPSIYCNLSFFRPVHHRGHGKACAIGSRHGVHIGKTASIVVTGVPAATSSSNSPHFEGDRISS